RRSRARTAPRATREKTAAPTSGPPPGTPPARCRRAHARRASGAGDPRRRDAAAGAETGATSATAGAVENPGRWRGRPTRRTIFTRGGGPATLRRHGIGTTKVVIEAAGRVATKLKPSIGSAGRFTRFSLLDVRRAVACPPADASAVKSNV